MKIGKLKDKFEPKEAKEPNPTNELDKWILALLYNTNNKLINSMKEYKIDELLQSGKAVIMTDFADI